jgi:glutamate/tyrosine decarboxylase-like PLP-dependent enzyme
MTFQTIGTERIGDAILHTCELASYLAEQLARSSLFEQSAVQATSSIANWSYAIVNHRTTRSDIDLFLEAIGSLARARLNTALDRRDLPASL